ncbi:3-deoxy-D-manno-octulosonic acid transferase [Candidatus Phycosocius spiralis]|uniref:3-deoxy-D-manno-octulosonic acid transferase n=1 Tax=Candidatus Phycosocius spiralis TaxID=2815099 RepID=A0ABQ4PYZ9_9PROT|nr:3-deoxy-D-manno-octulosonic acid transferase [Candidatus Phycosocius spiralis]GIU67899.1 3-deoxy-D-manno-octulosonic acid transferase [Candidatus Phycosocius spiralis]
MPFILACRATKGKEDPGRVNERLSTAPINRPEGTLVWIHGASVGESLLGFSLAQHLRAARPELTFLFTSATKTSADLMAKKLKAPDMHRYVPVDVPRATEAFIAGWKPNLAIFIEGEIWPNLLLATKKADIRLALVNARMTHKSAKGWLGRIKSARLLFGLFDLIMPADRRTRDAISLLVDAPLAEPGNLKLATSPLVVNQAELTALKEILGQRPVWLAASTHAGEEEIILASHCAIKRDTPDTLLILAPRHPERMLEVQAACAKHGFVPVLRSRGHIPTKDDRVWLWDTLGEMGLAMSLAPVTFMAGSLRPELSGHNPVEPIQLGSAVVSGHCVGNFLDLYQALKDEGGCVILDDTRRDRLGMVITQLLGDPRRRSRQNEAARHVIGRGGHAMVATVTALLACLEGKSS